MKIFGFIDAETLPGGKLEDFESDKKHPKTYKDPEKIKAWYEEQSVNKEEDYKKGALDTNSAKIITLGIAIDDQDPQVFYNEEENDIKLLKDFQEYIFDNKITKVSSTKTLTHEFAFVGHNIKNFDLQLMLIKCFQNKDELKHLGRLIYSARQRYNNDLCFDTMEIWTGSSGAYNYVKLDVIAKALNIAGKGDFDGSMVYDTWKNGEIDKIIKYQRDDVILVRKIFNQIRGIINV